MAEIQNIEWYRNEQQMKEMGNSKSELFKTLPKNNNKQSVREAFPYFAAAEVVAGEKLN